ncbi:MFS transporter [Cellulosimicrobium funkei]|uniref:MFS transporter n=1 Tax=Cellulosimicrobium funkei TaxID=264251 RepID=UPI0030FBA62D
MSVTAPAAPLTSRRYAWKVTLSSFVGNTLEYYDFLVYGTAAAIVFPAVFFPSENSFVATLSSLGTFAVGFLARPLGGMFFGRRGDKQGRKSTLVLTLAIMGTGTLLIGFLPSYDSIGLLAPALLVVLRLVQGFAVGGEWGGSMIIVLESTNPRHRGFYTSWPNTGGFSAQILITLVFAWVYTLDDAQLQSWGWRVPFWLSAVVLAVGLWMRRSLEETPVFTDAVAGLEKEGRNRSLTVENLEASQAAVRERQERDAAAATEPAPQAPTRGPLASVFLEDWRNLLRIVGLRFAEALPYFLLTVFVLSYGPQHLGIEKESLNTAILIMAVLAFPAHGIFSWVSDKIGRRPVYFFGALVVFVMAFPFFGLLNTGSFVLIVLGYVLMLNLGHNAINSIQPAFFAELFPADRRYSGAATGREIASIVAGGLTPFIATALAGEDGSRWQLVALYVMVGALITMLTVWKTPETFRRDLNVVGETVR